MPRLQNISLQTPVFNPVGFNSVVFEPKQGDMNLLANSLNVLEQRRVVAEEKMAAMDNAFGKVRAQLHNDPETMKWFQDYSEGYKQKVNEYAQRGDYANAMTAAVRLGEEALNNPELQARISTNLQYEQKKEDVMKMPISDIRKQRWLEQNPYNFNNYISKDDNGNIISADLSYDKLNWTPVSQVSLEALAEKAIQQYAERSSKGNVLDLETGLSTNTGFYAKYEPGLRENFIELLRSTPGAYTSVKQEMDDTLWQISKLENELSKVSDTDKIDALQKDINTLKDTVLGNNGIPMSVEEYAVKNTKNIIKNAAYYRGDTVSHQRYDASRRSGNSYEGNDEPIYPLRPELHPIASGGNIARSYEGEWKKNNEQTVAVSQGAATFFRIATNSNNTQQ